MRLSLTSYPLSRWLFIGLLLFLLFPPVFYQAPGAGLDNSYIISVHLAHKFDLVFGKDFVFTFGPLAILDNRFPIAVQRWVYLMFDGYFLFTLFFLLQSILKKKIGYSQALFIFLAVLLALPEPPFQWYFVFFLFYLFNFIKMPGKPLPVIQVSLLSIVSFYYKVNLGMTAIILFALALHYALLSLSVFCIY